MSEPENQYADFMARAYTMELEAVERYAQFAEQMDVHNNREVAELFRKLSAIEALHAKRGFHSGHEVDSCACLAPVLSPVNSCFHHSRERNNDSNDRLFATGDVPPVAGFHACVSSRLRWRYGNCTATNRGRDRQ